MFRRIIFFFLCLWVSCVIAVDVDYFIDNKILRTEEKDVCYSNLYKLYCNLKCGTKVGLCIEKYCYCIFAVKSRRDDQMIYFARPEDPLVDNDLNLDNLRQYDDNAYDTALDRLESREIDESSVSYSFRPTLRHHIAHFCPNLDIARQCIRTCMKEGKPAFCGKDHVCYCGHKYHNMDDTSNKNVADTYGQFRDLYEKYFGTHNYNAERDGKAHEND